MISSDLDKRELKLIRKGKCPTCRSRDHWVQGPSGGAATNIFCTKCDSAYNVGPMFAERIHNGAAS